MRLNEDTMGYLRCTYGFVYIVILSRVQNKLECNECSRSRRSLGWRAGRKCGATA